MPKLSNMTCDQYITLRALRYPSLWAGKSFSSAKLDIMDHLLSTIGNGITFHDFLDDILLTKKKKDALSQPSNYLFDGTKFYHVYKISKDDEFSRERPVHPQTGNQVSALTMEQIKELGWDDPTEYKWLENKSNSEEKGQWSPYPYFEKTYNILWQNKDELNKIPVDFLQEFINYYRTTLDFFTTDKQYFYYYACPAPSQTDKWINVLKEWQQIYEKNTAAIEDEQEKMQKFSKDYGLSYHGDMRAFLEERHKKTIDKCVQFIQETIELLENTISSNP